MNLNFTDKQTILNNKYFMYAAIIVLASYRFVFLDMDTPSIFISNLCAEDEAYYCTSGIAKFIAEKHPEVKTIDSNNYIGLMLYSHYPTYFSLKFLGNNFWALRLFPVLLSIISSLLLYDSLRLLLKKNSILLFATLLLSLDFTMFVFSRFNGPQIYSLAILTLLLWLFIKYQYKSTWHLLLLGILSFFSVSFIYIYNLYILGAFGLFFLLISFKQKKIHSIFYYTIGVFFGLLIYAVFLKLSNTSLNTVIATMQNHGGGSNISQLNSSFFDFITSSIALNFKTAFISIINNNIFRYNNILLLLFFMAIPIFFFNIKNSKPIIQILVLLLSFITIQNIFVPSYPIKKMVVVFPVFILFAFYHFDLLVNNIASFLSNFNKQLILLSSVFIGVFTSVLIFKIFNNPAFFKFYTDLFNDFTPPNKFLMYVQLFFLSVFSVFVVAYIFKKQQRPFAWTIISITPSVLFLFYYTVIEKNYKIRDALISENKNLNEKILLGDFTYYYQFYTNAIPIYNFYSLNVTSPNKIALLNDSILKANDVAFIVNKITYNSKKYNKFIGDTIVEGNTLNVVVNNHSVTNYKYIVLKRIRLK